MIEIEKLVGREVKRNVTQTVEGRIIALHPKDQRYIVKLVSGQKIRNVQGESGINPGQCVIMLLKNGVYTITTKTRKLGTLKVVHV